MRSWLIALCSLIAAPAGAAWHQASSAHFLIYADERPEKLRDFAVRLERFDQAVRALRNMQDLPPSYGNRVTNFVLKDGKAVRELAQDKTGFIAGFYRPSAGGSVAFVPRRLEGADSDEDVDRVFLHEYAHHLMMQELATPYPEWLIEGFAEFMSSARFEKNGAVGLGLPAKHRAYGLLQGPSLPLETLLSGKYEKITVGERESIYGRGWLMSHFFVFEAGRKGQLETYLAGIAKGEDPLAAARAAFGDLKTLERDLDRYLRQTNLRYWQVRPGQLKVPAIAITPLSAASVQALPHLIQLKNGAGKTAAAAGATQLRAIAAQSPGDPFVEVALAEAELTAEDEKAAEAAADRALKTDAQSAEAMLLKGRAIMERAKNAEPFDPKLFAVARQWFSKANRIDPEDPEPLMYFFMSYIFAGERPSANAVAALHYASNLAPQDLGLRLNSALQYLRDGKLKEARLTLAPIAYDPHGRQNGAMARAMIAKIDSGETKAAERIATE
jgi:hypothetical protein